MPDYAIIIIDGKLQIDLGIDLLEVQVDTNLYLPGMFVLTIKDELDPKSEKLKYADADTFEVGAEVKIEIETDEIADEARAVKGTLIVGEITALEPSFSAEGVPVFQVRGYDRAHRLTHGKKTRTYGDADPLGSGITEMQIINTIVGETEGITSAKIDSSGLNKVRYAYVMQYNQTDLEFLWSRAQALGYQVYVENQSLCFQKADAHRGHASFKPAKLTWRRNLASFEPRVTLMHHTTKAVVKGWDPDTKAAIEGQGTSDGSHTVPKIGWNQKGSALAKKSFRSQAEEVVVDQPVVTVNQARAMAGARFAQAESEFIQAEGVCRQGDPRLLAGRIVTVEGVGQRFSGDYYVTEARHVLSQGMYRVTFSVSGRVPNTLGYLLNGDNGHERGLVHGVVTAKVVNIEDPENLGRVQVLFPWLPKYKSADLASNWARIAAPMGGKDRGFFFLPEVDDEVLVAFEHGDVDYPYVVGVLWNKVDKPPAGTKGSVLANDRKKVDQRVIRSRSGHLIILDDTKGQEQIIIQDKTQKNSITINSKENTMSIRAKGDLSIEAGGRLTIKSKGDMSLDTQAKGALTTKADLALQATGKGSWSGAELALEGKAKSELKGAQVAIQAQAQAEISGNAAVTVKSSGMAQIQGSLVKIN
jgi:uncharacterized protein involved in type VI secretion and phage assembly